MSRLDFLFVKPNSKKVNYQVLDDFKMTAIEPPLWPAILAGYCREQGLDVDIIDAEVEGFSNEILSHNIKELNPKTLVINICGHNPSASTQSMTGVKELINQIYLNCEGERPKFRIVLHGLHPSALPYKSLEETKADGVIIGEGLDTIIQLQYFDPVIYDLNYLKKEPWICPSISLFDLTKLPQPAWDLLPIEKYRAHSWHCFGKIDKRQGYGVVYTSLGCPYDCSFCVIHVMTNGARRVRFRTVEQVMNNIRFWVSNGITNIRLIDENFTINRQHALDICEAISEEYCDKLNIWAYASLHSLDKRMAEALSSAGIKWLGIGFESGSQKVLNASNKKQDVSSILDIVYMCKGEGINIGSNFIFGLPEDTMETMQETLDLALKVNGEWANFYSCMAYPGSKLYEEAQTFPWYTKPTSWSAYSQHSHECQPLGTKYLTPAEVLKFRDEAFTTYFTNPKYLDMIETKFGLETRSHIENMTKLKLKRKLIC